MRVKSAAAAGEVRECKHSIYGYHREAKFQRPRDWPPNASIGEEEEGKSSRGKCCFSLAMYAALRSVNNRKMRAVMSVCHVLRMTLCVRPGVHRLNHQPHDSGKKATLSPPNGCVHLDVRIKYKAIEGK